MDQIKLYISSSLSYLVGGLLPDLPQFGLDAITLCGLGFATLTMQPRKPYFFLGSCLVTVLSSGLTSRWPLTLPMIPLAFIEMIRRSPRLGKKTQISAVCLSGICIMAAAALAVAFPPLQLPPFQGPYRVGVVNLYVDPPQKKDSCSLSTKVQVRIAYPTLDEKEATVPYFAKDIAAEFCNEMHRVGAPKEIREHGWILHTWRLLKVAAIPNASLAPGEHLFPVVVQSHGLVGSASVYSYQSLSLASMGYVVISLTHTDRSAPVVRLHNNTLLYYNHELTKLWAKKGENEKYVRERRKMTDHRVQEMVVAAEAMQRLNQGHDLGDMHPSFQNRLDTDRTTFMGHSFGAVTAITAAARRPDLATCVVAHEPALDWTPDDARGSLFDSRIHGLNNTFSGGTGGLKSDPTPTSVHDLDMLFLFSNEWKISNGAWNHLLHEMYTEKIFGRPGGPSGVHYIEEAHHTEFSDTSMLMPLWLSRSAGMTGTRNPIETGEEIHTRTVNFLQRVHKI